MSASGPDNDRNEAGADLDTVVARRLVERLKVEMAELGADTGDDESFERVLEELDKRKPDTQAAPGVVKRWRRKKESVTPQPAPVLRLSELLLQLQAARVLQQREMSERREAGEDASQPAEGEWSVQALRRPLPVSIYVARTEAAGAVEQALHDFMEAFGLEVVREFPPVAGSWYRAIVARTRKAQTSAEVTELLAKVERALEMPVLHQPQANVDAAQGDAVAKLITALDATPTAIIQMGSVLLVKVDGVLMVRNLTQTELAHLESNPVIFKDPAAALHELQRLGRGLEHAGGVRPADSDETANTTLDLKA